MSAKNTIASADGTTVRETGTLDGSTVPADDSTVTVDDSIVLAGGPTDPANTRADEIEGILKNYIDGSPTGHNDVINQLLDGDEQSIFSTLMNVRGVHKRTLIHSAAWKGENSTLRRVCRSLSEENWCKLLEEKDARNGDTALHLAASNGHPDTVSCILYESVGNEEAWKKLLKIQNRTGYTPVHGAVRREDSGDEFNAICPVHQPQKVKAWFEVLKVKSNEGNTAVHEAARNGDLIKLQAMIEQLPKVSKRRLLRMQNDDGHSALHYTIDYHHPHIIRYITKIENGNDPIEMEGEVAEEVAKVPEHHPEVPKWAFDIAKDYLDGLPNNLCTQLSEMTAYKQIYFDHLEYCQDDEGYTVLHFAALMGDDDILRKYRKEYIRKKCKKDWHGYLKIQDTRNGNTALHLAATNGHPETASYILYGSVGDKKVRMELLKIRNKAGDTPVHCAVRRGVFGEFDKICPADASDKVTTWSEVLEVKNNKGNTAEQEAKLNEDRKDLMLARLQDLQG